MRTHPLRSGALAGMATVLVFTAVHQLMISDIWFSLLPMLVVGGLCGLALAWSYRVVFAEPGAGSWLRYNLAYLAVLVLLGVVSVAVFEPVTTAEAVMAGNGPPDALIGQALPFTGLYTLAAGALLSAVWGRSPGKAGALFLTTTALVFLFGLNISVVGLVEMSGGGYRALAEFFGLTVLILAGNAAFYLAFERRALFGRPT